MNAFDVGVVEGMEKTALKTPFSAAANVARSMKPASTGRGVIADSAKGVREAVIGKPPMATAVKTPKPQASAVPATGMPRARNAVVKPKAQVTTPMPDIAPTTVVG